ncbi:MAG: hypothetical protein R2762_03485 [Bryobacteraceae bacterium]
MRLSLLFLAALPAMLPAADFGVRLILGLGDPVDTRWDGSINVTGGALRSIEPWRFEANDGIDGNTWRCAIHPIRLFGANARQRPAANGVVVWLTAASDQTTIEVKTAQGGFVVNTAAIPFGKTVTHLNGRVMADRVPPASPLTTSPAEQDYPAAATGKSGEVWLTWMEFQHHAEHNKLRANMRERPSSFEPYASTPPGDQIWARRQSGGRWSDPIAVSEPGGDLYRPAVAVDGRGRAWVFWSANQGRPGAPNFDLWARRIDGATAASPIRITRDAGSDVFPVAATDSAGNVHVAWQAWRKGKAEIHWAVQNGDGFRGASSVSVSAGNEWNPSIAADGKGRVTVAYESYRNGDYDIFLRTWDKGKWGIEAPGATGPTYQAYPSLAYEPSGRLWMAYEEGGMRWGKDFGAYESSGVALYQGRAIRMRGWEPDGRVVEPATDPGDAAPGGAEQRVDSKARQARSDEWIRPQPDAWKNRAMSRPTPNNTAPRNSHPRLTVDASGRLWMAFRSNHPIWWNPLGTTWSEWVSSYDGSQWTGPIYVMHSDNLLDNRPAIVSKTGGEVLLIGSADGRREFHRMRRGAANVADIVDDPYNNDLWLNTVTLPPGSGALDARAAARLPRGGLGNEEMAEKQVWQRMRAAKVDGKYRIVRGEFHRHSEVSADGGNDGSLLEQWRYMLDAAGMDWVGCCDHDNGGGREYSWWINQKLTDMFYTEGSFVPMFSYERSVRYPEGHRNVVFAQRGVRPLPRLPITAPDPVVRAPDTQMLYDYLKKFNGVAAMHTSGTNMGTDWRDNDPQSEPVVEIYQGDRQNYEMPDAPRTNKEADSIGGWQPKGFVSLALEMGYKMAFQASSDHISTHMSYCNILATDLTRESLLDAFQKRHVYGATDDIYAEFIAYDAGKGKHLMGDAFSSDDAIELDVKLEGTGPFAKVWIVKDGKYVYSSEPNQSKVSFRWKDNEPGKGKTSYYYIRGLQQDGEVVWVSPVWVSYK